jgi:hypothetical protein
MTHAITRELGKQAASPCRVRTILEGLDSDEQDKLLEAIADQTRSTISLARILTKSGHPIAEKTMRKHREGWCSCPR